jgi:predicted nicotinamide N-methyase
LQQQEELFKNKTVIEIGAGAGLPALFASTLCKEVVATDGDEEVVKILEFNVATNELSL